MATFLADPVNFEDGDFNQYWYSQKTIDKIVEDLVEVASSGPKTMAFLSTPSLYFSLPEEVRASCFVFDFDKKWESDRGFVHYDFNSPEAVPASLLGQCDMVVVDPPFITHEVWRKYGETANLLLKKGVDESTGAQLGKVILTTVIENAPLLEELLGAKPQAFMPSIPNLVYQYNLYTNYDSRVFAVKNPEIPE